MSILKDRIEAGKILADKISDRVFEKNIVILAIPRGGVIIGKQIAKKLRCSLDVIISKKITPPSSPEYAIGAITHDGTIYQGENWDMFSKEPNFQKEIEKKKSEVKRRIEEYRGSSDYDLGNKTVILVDDGIATGATIFVLLRWLVKHKISKIVLAVPVIPADTYEKMKPFVDDIVTLQIPPEFSAVGEFYEEFNQVTDEEVMTILSNLKNKGDTNDSD